MGGDSTAQGKPRCSSANVRGAALIIRTKRQHKKAGTISHLALPPVPDSVPPSYGHHGNTSTPPVRTNTPHLSGRVACFGFAAKQDALHRFPRTFTSASSCPSRSSSRHPPIHVLLPQPHRSGPSHPTSTVLTRTRKHIDDGLVFVGQSCMIDASCGPASRSDSSTHARMLSSLCRHLVLRVLVVGLQRHYAARRQVGHILARRRRVERKVAHHCLVRLAIRQARAGRCE